ncbi:MAG: hypothetical protein K0S44_746 [Bacteroidetes bacterium]|jgi:hypothetical protein|nr:hypothetical protein [Bacteroidota bacterium]
MKAIKLFALFFLASTGLSASPLIQDSLGLPGDNLDLYGVLELFKKSESPEEFEKALNTQDNKLNNLDLNNDQKTDYIYVIDKTESDAHALILRVATSDTKTQDVAVIEIEKKGEENAVVQIVGDEALYGKDYIIEPADEKAPVTKTEKTEDSKSTVIVNVYHWPAVRHIYRPTYVRYVSPWGFSHYPDWWNPWPPMLWAYYHPHWYPFRIYHRRTSFYRTHHAHKVYHNHVHRSVSPAPHRTNNKNLNSSTRKGTEQAPRKQKPVVKGSQSRPKQNPGVKGQSRPKQSPAPRQKNQGSSGRRK